MGGEKCWELIRTSEPMRGLVLMSIVSLAGAVGEGSSHVRSEASDPDPVATNTVMTENGDGEAERIRRDCLAKALTADGMCDARYVVETRQLVEPNLPSSNAHDVVYSGGCL
jgi:hypothetical protein